MTNLEKLLATRHEILYNRILYFQKRPTKNIKTKNMKRQFKFKKNNLSTKEVQSPHKTNAKPTRKIYLKKGGGGCKPEKGELYDIYDSVKLLEKKKKCKSKPY